MLLPSKHLLTSVKFSFCTDNLPRVSLFLLFFNIQFTNRRAYPPVHTHVHHWQSDCSFAWVFSLSGLELAGTSLRVQESKTPRSGWAPQEKVTLKRDAGRCFCCLPPGGSTGQGGGQDPSLPILLEHASRVTLRPWGNHGHCRRPGGGPWRALHPRIQLYGLCRQRE